MISADSIGLKNEQTIDPLFKVEVLRATPGPQQVIYAAMHQDYSSDFVFDELHLDKEVWKRTEGVFNPTGRFVTEWDGPDEDECGDRIVKHLLSGNRGHYGPLEHPQIVFSCGYFPHSTLQQVRTHRVGISFDCQSFRYTGQQIIDVATNKIPVEQAFYLRPVGDYADRQGKKYHYSTEDREDDIGDCYRAAVKYARRVQVQGFSEEHARGLIPFDYRQHWVMSVNVRSLMHLLDMRWPKNAQLECQQLCDLIWPHFQSWAPSVAEWYEKSRAKKARLAP